MTAKFFTLGPEEESPFVEAVETIEPAHFLAVLTAPGGGQYSIFAGGTGLLSNPLRGEIAEEPAPNVLKLTYPDGRVELYEHYIAPPPGTDWGRTFLSRGVDAQGNEAVIEYDGEPYPTRIHRIVDATGGATDFHYDYSGEPYLVTSIDDP